MTAPGLGVRVEGLDLLLAAGVLPLAARGALSSCSILALTGGATVAAMGWTTRIGARPPAHQASSGVACVAAAWASATARCHPPRQTAGSRPGAEKGRSHHVLGGRGVRP